MTPDLRGYALYLCVAVPTLAVLFMKLLPLASK